MTSMKHKINDTVWRLKEDAWYSTGRSIRESVYWSMSEYVTNCIKAAAYKSVMDSTIGISSRYSLWWSEGFTNSRWSHFADILASYKF
jgi:hypothetical protein